MKNLIALFFVMFIGNAYASDSPISSVEDMPHSILCQFTHNNNTIQSVFKYKDSINNGYIEVSDRRRHFWMMELTPDGDYGILRDPVRNFKIIIKAIPDAIDDLGISTNMASFHGRNLETSGFCLIITRHFL